MKEIIRVDVLAGVVSRMSDGSNYGVPVYQKYALGDIIDGGEIDFIEEFSDTLAMVYTNNGLTIKVHNPSRIWYKNGKRYKKQRGET